MTKKTILFILALLSTLTASAYKGRIGGIYYYYSPSDKTAMVTYKDDNYNSYTGIVSIPATFTYNGVTYSVTSISSSAFKGCSTLTSVTIPNSVTAISDGAFSGCSGLTKVELNSNAIASKAYGIEYSLKTIFGSQVKEYILGDDITSIGFAAFAKCSSLTSVKIGNGLTTIGYEAFYNCNNLSYINIPNSVTSIDKYAFSGCSSLKSVNITDIAAWCKISFSSSDSNPLYYAKHLFVNGREIKDLTIPNNVTSIGKSAFAWCSGLTSVTIPNSVTSIGESVFYNCSGLTDIYCYAENVPTTGSSVFYNVPISSATLHVPAASVKTYKATEPWSGFGTIVALDMPKCATPTIAYVDGKLKFRCETDGAKLHYKYSFKDGEEGDESEATIPQTIIISVYATKEDYEDSDVMTKEINLRGDANLDGEVGMPDVMFIVNKILNGKFPDEE